MLVARQSTARTVTVGPVLDAAGVAVTDGVVGDFKIAKNGGAPAALNGSATLTHRHTGFYSLALTATDLDTVGGAEVTIDDTVNSCALKEITVVEEAVYDALYAASAPGYVANAPVNAAQWGGVNVTGMPMPTYTQPTGFLAATFPATVASTTNITAGTMTNLTNAPTAGDFTAVMKTSIGTAVAASAVASVTGGVGGNVGGDIQGNVNGSVGGVAPDGITGDSLDATAILAIQSGLSTLDAAGVRTALGMATANLDAQLGAIDDFLDTEVAAIKAKTDQLTFTSANKVDATIQAAADLAAAVAQKIAHVILRRTMANVEAAADGDVLDKSSLYGMVQQAQESNTTTHANKLTVFKTDGTTELGQITIATDPDAEPIVGAS